MVGRSTTRARDNDPPTHGALELLKIIQKYGMRGCSRRARPPEGFKMLTSSETRALEAILENAIVKSKEEDDGNPVYHEVDANGVNPFADKRTQSDVYTSLAMKGYIECSGTEDPSGGETLEHVCITPKGLEALKSMKGVH